ncbi:MAG: hypothetical protein FJ295_16285 [Planctomycetes bacterium]|nr:hypothetical protein [Planctomycetota bacterium]
MLRSMMAGGDDTAPNETHNMVMPGQVFSEMDVDVVRLFDLEVVATCVCGEFFDFFEQQDDPFLGASVDLPTLAFGLRQQHCPELRRAGVQRQA